jgi:hypothetical protein
LLIEELLVMQRNWRCLERLVAADLFEEFSKQGNYLQVSRFKG